MFACAHILLCLVLNSSQHLHEVHANQSVLYWFACNGSQFSARRSAGDHFAPLHRVPLMKELQGHRGAVMERPFSGALEARGASLEGSPKSASLFIRCFLSSIAPSRSLLLLGVWYLGLFDNKIWHVTGKELSC